MSRVLFVLPDEDLPEYTWARIRKLCDAYFPTSSFQCSFAARAGSVAFDKDLFNGTVQLVTSGLIEHADILVVSEAVAESLSIPEGKRLYVIEHNHWHVFFRLKNQALDERDWRYIGKNSFNRLGSMGGADHLQFFPYGFIFREPGSAANIDEFGFRISADLSQLATRSPDHKLIVVLGGSAVWSWFAFDDETFCSQLNVMLQRELDSAGKGQRVTVLNFGQGSAVVLNQQITYLLHSEPLRPDVVISHDGFNDVFWGLTTDPALLSRNICAPFVLETWARRLHGRLDVPERFPPENNVPVVNFPRQIIHAYLERKRQLDRIVRASGARHVSVLQPHARSKTLSDLEKKALAERRYIGNWAEPLEKFVTVYDQLSELIDRLQDMRIVNLHRRFQSFGSDETLFQDRVHTTPAGDFRIAEIYANLIFQEGLL